MINKIYNQRDKITVYLTDILAQFLDDEREETGDNKSSIVRRALNEYMAKRIKEKIKNREKVKDYMVKFYGELK